MNKKKLITLINKEIDNELTPDEGKLLQSEIKHNPDFATMYKDYKKVADILQNDSLAEDSVDLQNEIMNKIDKNKYPSVMKKYSMWSMFEFSPKARTIIAYSFGVFTGIIILSLFYSTGLLNNSEAGISGTMGDMETYSNFTTGDEVEINLENIQGSIKSQFNSDMMMANLELTSSDKYKINFSFDEHNVTLYAVKPISMNQESSFTSGRNYIIINNKGLNNYLMLFRNNTPQSDIGTIRIKLVSETGQVNEYSLQTKN